MNYKFTSDGRKVAVIGALNAKETIVQEIFVTDGTEFPAGEHFVVKTLLDSPAETYKAKKEREIEQNIKELEKERSRLSSQIADFRFKAEAAAAKLKWLAGTTQKELDEVVGNLRSMMCGEYTHVVIVNHTYTQILEWDHKIFSNSSTYSSERFESIRLISLFGQWNGRRLSLSWKVNSYQDGSGREKEFIPCKSLNEATREVREIIESRECLSDDDYALCLEYGIPVDEAKNNARIKEKRERKEKEIATIKGSLAKKEAELLAIEP